MQTRVKQLDAYQASLQRALAKKPPALPVVRPATPAAQQRVVYRRPPAIVVVKHTQHGDDGYEAQGNDGGGDG